MSDGASVVLLTRRDIADKRGIKVLGKILSFAVDGCRPDIMGIGPIYAIPKALEKAKMTLNEVDIIEINEAFGS